MCAQESSNELMSLFQMLIDRRAEILAISEEKTVALAALRPNTAELKAGLPIFMDQLVAVLKKSHAAVSPHDEVEIMKKSGVHGAEMLRLGYTLSHVVHAYGALCQSITQVASEGNFPVSAAEFHNLNRCLDIAIAGAVTEFESIRNAETRSQEAISLGYLAHELRNALNRAVMSSEMIAKGIVGLGGSTARVLQASLIEMHRLISRSLIEVRVRANAEIFEEPFFVMELVSQLIVTAEVEAARSGQTLQVEIDPKLELNTDRHLILGAIGNLVQNAIKFSKPGSTIRIVAREQDDQVVIEILDACGGIPDDRMKSLFVPFQHGGSDRSGLGLGLVITRDAVLRCGGSIAVRNTAGGCAFALTLPKRATDPVLRVSVV